VGVGFTIYTDDFTDLTLDVIGESIDGLMGLVGSYMAFYLFELANWMICKDQKVRDKCALSQEKSEIKYKNVILFLLEVLSLSPQTRREDWL